MLVDVKQVMQQVKDVIGKIEPHDSVERYEQLGVTVELGDARIVSHGSRTTQNGETKTITTRAIVATGARPLVPPFKDWITSIT